MMELYKIFKLLNDLTVSKFARKKWIEVKVLSGAQYAFNKNIRFKNSMLFIWLQWCCIAIEGTITVEGDNGSKMRNRKLIFKNNAPFR